MGNRLAGGGEREALQTVVSTENLGTQKLAEAGKYLVLPQESNLLSESPPPNNNNNTVKAGGPSSFCAQATPPPHPASPPPAHFLE